MSPALKIHAVVFGAAVAVGHERGYVCSVVGLYVSHVVYHVPLCMCWLCICSVRSIIHAPVTYLRRSRYATFHVHNVLR
jgi:hypothetical protein